MTHQNEHFQRLSPKLRMIINGDHEVNGHRAELSASVQSSAAASERAAQQLTEAVHIKVPTDELKQPKSVKEATDTAKVSCFVHLTSPAAPVSDISNQILPSREQRTLTTAELTPAEVENLSRGRGQTAFERNIAYVETGNPLSQPKPTSILRSHEGPASRTIDDGGPPPPSQVIVGIVDVGGFDFAHPDFIRDGKTRFLAIWEQGADKATGTRAANGTPAIGYGRILTGEMMNGAITDAAAANVAASDFLPQWNQQPGSHGTHVASIAAGNSGVCPEALIVGVSIALTEEDVERRSTFFDSTRLAHAIDFLFAYGDNLGIPVAINISLGTNGHAHDGTSPIARWIDSALSRPGRCVCVAAGNSGQEAAQFEGDIGYVSGRIHASGHIPARGLTADLEWRVVGNGIVDVSENELEIWYHPGDDFAVQVQSPTGFESEWVGPGEYYENYPLPTHTFLSVYNERYHPANGANRISVFLSPRLKTPIVGIEAGTWTVRLKGIEVRDGRYDAWIERDDPRPLGRIGEVDAWLFPSYFSSRSNVDSNSVSSLACGRDVIAVGNADSENEQIHTSSSQGPTWDGRPKPDIVAPGTNIVAARGFGGLADEDQWLSMTGTSMASPFVTGVAAQMLAREPRLTSTQIVGIMRRTAQPLPGSDYSWQDDAGFGVVQPGKCVSQVKQPFESIDIKDTESP